MISQALDIRAEFQWDWTALDPPEKTADLHVDLVDLHARILTAQNAFADRAETATDLDELDQSAEAEFYRAMATGSVSLCQEFQATIDATAAQANFADVPWIPGDLKGGGRSHFRVLTIKLVRNASNTLPDQQSRSPDTGPQRAFRQPPENGISSATS